MAKAGSIVIFQHPKTSDGHSCSPAIVQSMSPDGKALLHVFAPGDVLLRRNVKQGSNDGEWRELDQPEAASPAPQTLTEAAAEASGNAPA